MIFFDKNKNYFTKTNSKNRLYWVDMFTLYLNNTQKIVEIEKYQQNSKFKNFVIPIQY